MREVVLCTVQDRKSDQKDGIEVYDIHTRAAVHDFRSAPGVWAQGVSFLADQGALFSVLKDKSLLQIHRWGKEHVAQKMILPEKINVFKVSRGGVWCAGGTSTGRVYIWEVASGDMLAAMDVHYQEITSLEFSMDEGLLITGSEDARIGVIALADSLAVSTASYETTAPAVLEGHKLAVTQLFCGFGSSRTARLFSASLDQTVKVWDVSLRLCLLTIRFQSPLTSLTVDSAERAVFVGSQEGIISQFEIYGDSVTSAPQSSSSTAASSEVLFKGHRDPITSLSLTLESNLLVSASAGGDINLWDVSTAQLLSTLRAPGGKAVSCIISILPSITAFPSLKQEAQFQVLNRVVADRVNGHHVLNLKLHEEDNLKDVDYLQRIKFEFTKLISSEKVANGSNHSQELDTLRAQYAELKAKYTQLQKYSQSAH